MFCEKCGNPLKEDQKFCGKCGNPVIAQAVPESSASTNTQNIQFSQNNNQYTNVPAAPQRNTKKIVIPIVVGVIVAIAAVYWLFFSNFSPLGKHAITNQVFESISKDKGYSVAYDNLDGCNICTASKRNKGNNNSSRKYTNVSFIENDMNNYYSSYVDSLSDQMTVIASDKGLNFEYVYGSYQNNSYYMYIARVDSSMVYAYYDNNCKEDAESLLQDIGYWYT